MTTTTDYTYDDSDATTEATMLNEECCDSTVCEDEYYYDDSEDAMERLRNEVRAASLSCPQQVSEGMEWTSITLSGSTLTFKYTIDEDEIEISAFEAVKDELKSSIMEELRGDSDSREMLSMCRNAKVNITFKFVGGTSGRAVTVTAPYYSL